MTVLFLWLRLRGGRGRLVVVGLWRFFFFAGVGGCRLRSGGRGRLLGPGLCFFFLLPIAVVCGCGWWGNGGSGCCDGLVFFFFPLLLRFLDLEFVGVVGVVDRR